MPFTASDLVGQQFGRLTVMERHPVNTKTGMAQWVCRCECGTVKVVRTAHLNGGNVKSCGCLRNRRPKNFRDITGERFGRLVVTGMSQERTGAGKPKWNCICDCGTECTADAYSLTTGNKKSCGCLRVEVTRKRAMTHGMTETREYSIWCNMKDRCYRENNPAYNRYGGRGIVMCDAWRDSFETFLADMGPSPSNKHSIDRIDNDGPYSPQNCRWATKRTQANNTMANVFIEHDGRRLTAAQWARECGLDPKLLYDRLARGIEGDALFVDARQSQILRYNGEDVSIVDWAKRLNLEVKTIYSRLERGWSVERTLSTPQNHNTRTNSFWITANGETKLLADWSKETGISTQTIAGRLKRGWTPEEAVSKPPSKYGPNHRAASS